MDSFPTIPDETEWLRRSLVEKPPADPVCFFELMNRLYQSSALLFTIIAATRSGIFDLLQTPRTPGEMAVSFPYPSIVSNMIPLLLEAGLITEEDGKIRCSDLATAFFCTGSPYSQAAYLDKLFWHLEEHWLTLSERLESGPRLYSEEEFFSRHSLPSMASNALTGRLQDVITRIAALPRFSECRRMIDLGGGHGLYALALVSLHPSLHAVVFDLPGVTEYTRRYIRRYGMEDRVSVCPGDFLTDDVGTGYDIVLSSSNPSGKKVSMVPVIAASLTAGGYFVNVQPGDDDTNAAPPWSMLEWELWNFHGVTTPKSGWEKKKPFFTPEYRQALSDAGLTVISRTRIPDPYLKDHSVVMLIAQKGWGNGQKIMSSSPGISNSSRVPDPDVPVSERMIP